MWLEHVRGRLCRGGLPFILSGEQPHTIDTVSVGPSSPLLLVGPSQILVLLEAQQKTLMWETRRGLKEEVSLTHGVGVLWRVGS